MSYVSYWDWLPKEIQGEIMKYANYGSDENRLALHREIRDRVDMFREEWDHWENRGHGLLEFRLCYIRRAAKNWYWTYSSSFSIDESRLYENL